jgi:hypothetical protein
MARLRDCALLGCVNACGAGTINEHRTDVVIWSEQQL